MNNEYVDSKQRKYLIIKRLLNQEHLSYQQLSEDYYVSRSSIANDISYSLRRYFSCYKRQAILKRTLGL